MEAQDKRAAEVLGFWFRDTNRDKRWFERNPGVDDEIRAQFLALYEQGAAGGLANWKSAAGDCLALTVLLDQFPRNMFRDTARAFAADPLALEAARHAIAMGYDRIMKPAERLFAYLPFEHAESIAEQETACALMKALECFPETDDAYRYAVLHRDIVRRFGRFPHRNAALGRPSTQEELDFLKEPGSSF
jgi:uncharacterized protein (DUF924 family)